MRAVLIGMSSAIVCGCAAPIATFPGEERAIVWKAMVAAAESPEYEDLELSRRWIVRENTVWANPQDGRIEVHRLLHRVRRLPMQPEVKEERDWLFIIRMFAEEDGTPPTAEFRSRNVGPVPAQVREEANRYFATVRSLLQ